MKTNERLHDYTNRFFKNHNTCVGVRDDQVVDCYKKASEIARSLRRSMSQGPPQSRPSWRS
jgi:hypothetical protein